MTVKSSGQRFRKRLLLCNCAIKNSKCKYSSFKSVYMNEQQYKCTNMQANKRNNRKCNGNRADDNDVDLTVYSLSNMCVTVNVYGSFAYSLKACRYVQYTYLPYTSYIP